VPFGRHWFEVRVPDVAPNAIVVTLGGAPLGYALPFFPPDARFFGIDNNISAPWHRTRMQAEIATRLQVHDGPVYALAFPGGAGTKSLAHYGLQRLPATCVTVRTNMSTSPLELCRLERMRGG
jgi:hypothetical protein